jgi:hypothetical protein
MTTIDPEILAKRVSAVEDLHDRNAHRGRTRSEEAPTDAPVDLDALEAALARATPAPWISDDYRVYGPFHPDDDKSTYPPTLFNTKYTDSRFVGDADACELLRNNAAAMIAEIRRLRAEVQQAHAAGVAAGIAQEQNRCRAPDCMDNEDETCSRWLRGDCPDHQDART